MHARSKAPEGVRRKTKHLIRAEGKSPKEAYGAAWGMHRSGSLTSRGKYKRVGGRKGSRKGQSRA